MNRSTTALGSTLLLAGSLLLGSGTANAATAPAPLPCPPGTHHIDPGLMMGDCGRDAAPADPSWCGYTFNVKTCLYDGGAFTNQPDYSKLPSGLGPAPGQPGSLTAPAPALALQPASPERRAAVPAAPAAAPRAADAPAYAEAETDEESAVPAPAPKPAPAVVLPATEAQAVEILRTATATTAEKDAALAIVQTKISGVLDKALGNR